MCACVCVCVCVCEAEPAGHTDIRQMAVSSVYIRVSVQENQAWFVCVHVWVSVHVQMDAFSVLTVDINNSVTAIEQSV